MTTEEVRWHAFCIATSQLVRLSSKGHIGSVFRDDWDGVVHFIDSQHAIFSWQTKERNCETFLHFVDRSDGLVPAWVRSVCHSVAVATDG